MSQPSLEELAPSYVRERRFLLSLSVDAKPAANQSLVVAIDYSKALPEGIVLPLIFEVHGPSQASYVRREFVRRAPQSVVITPKEGGEHLITIREAAHNRWWGSLHFTALGSKLLSGRPRVTASSPEPLPYSGDTPSPPEPLPPTAVLIVDADNITPDGSNRAEILIDSSGAGNDMTSPSEAERFDIIASWRNGKPALSSMNANKFARVLAFSGGELTESTIYVAGLWSAHGSDRIAYDGATVDKRHMLAHSITTGNNAEVYMGTVLDPGAGAPSNGAPYVAAVRYSAGNVSAIIDAHGEGRISWVGNAGSNVMAGAYLGCRFSMTLFFRSIFAHFEIHNTVQDIVDVESGLTELRTKYLIVP